MGKIYNNVLVRGLLSPIVSTIPSSVCILVCNLLSPFTVQGVGQLQEQLQSSENEKEMFRQRLTRKDGELTRAEETIRREQQVRQRVHTYHYVQCKGPFPKVCPRVNCTVCTEVEAFLFPVQEFVELQKQLQSIKGEKQMLRKELRQQMTWKTRLLVHTRGLYAYLYVTFSHISFPLQCICLCICVCEFACMFHYVWGVRKELDEGQQQLGQLRQQV